MRWRLRTWAIVGGALAFAAAGIVHAFPGRRPWRIYARELPGGTLDVRLDPNDPKPLAGNWWCHPAASRSSRCVGLIWDASSAHDLSSLLSFVGVEPEAPSCWARIGPDSSDPAAWGAFYAQRVRPEDGEIVPALAGAWTLIRCPSTESSGAIESIELATDGSFLSPEFGSGWCRVQGGLLALGFAADPASPRLFRSDPAAEAWESVIDGATLRR